MPAWPRAASGLRLRKIGSKDMVIGMNALQFALPLLVLFATALPASAGPTTADRIDFQVTLLRQDPFDPVNALQPAKTAFRRGEVVTVVINGILKPGFHTYPITQRTAEQPEPLSSLAWNDLPPDIKPLWPIRESKPKPVDTHVAGVWLEYEHPFTWSQDLVILPSAEPGPKTLRFQLKLQVCDERSCLWGTHALEVPLEVSDAPAVPLTDALKQRLETKAPAIEIVPVPAETRTKETPREVLSGPTPQVAPPAERGLFAMILASMGAAVAMLFTPCVFPMIPITVSFFLKQSERENHNALATAAVYSLTIIIVLALSVLVLGQVIVTLANNAWLNLALGGVLVFFALSLFGMYEIELPAGLARFTSAREGRGGYAGAFFMALTFTITSFTCTGPFLGPLLVSVKELKLNFGDLLISSLAYSATFAAPFFVLALFPRLLKTLPKSGSWLNSVKVVMGFLELAAALKFLGNTDIALNPGNPRLFNYETVLCAWIALSVACGLYLLGTFRLPHDSPLEHIGVPRMLLATVFLGLALYIAPALYRDRPQGVIGEGVIAFLPLDTRTTNAESPGTPAQAHLDWHMDYEKAWQQAVRENKPLFIDFTGVNCTNCRDNEQRVFPRPEVREELEKYVRVQLYTDSVPRSGLSRQQALDEAALNKAWQEHTFADVTTPFYAVFQPAKDKPFADGKLKGTIIGTKAGRIPNNEIGQFVGLLRGPLHSQVARTK